MHQLPLRSITYVTGHEFARPGCVNCTPSCYEYGPTGFKVQQQPPPLSYFNLEANHSPCNSFGDPNAQPPTPRQTPNSATFPSPVFETPKQHQGAFTEPGSWTPRFAEDYSVFNSTPGNLRGADDPFADFQPVTPASSHKRLLSAEGFAAQIAAHVNHFSPNPNQPLPPVGPSGLLPSSPGPLRVPQSYTADSNTQLSPDLSKHRTPKKVRRAAPGQSDSDPAPVQTATPPPTARKGGRKLAPKLNMQDDQGFDQPDFTAQQQNDMAALMGNPGDMFSYPMSAPVNAPPNFWDTSASMSMDMDFAVSGSMFQPVTSSQHQHAESFDWSSDMQLFQDPSAPLPPPPSSNQENVQPARRERPLAPKLDIPGQIHVSTNASVPATYALDVHDPFGIMAPGDGVDPGLLFSRPQTAAMDSSFNGADLSTVDGIDMDTAPATGDFRRTNGVKEARNGKMPDRASASSPIKPSVRPGLSRSMSENRGKKVRGRGPLPALAPAARPSLQAGGSGVESSRPAPRPSGRTSPLKHQHRLSSLASIPEACTQSRSRTSVKFTIDSRGRARAETTVMAEGAGPENSFPRSRASRDAARQHDWESSDDESSTDDEPIIIPSRNTSFNASFALPDPRKPVGSIFHSSRRSISDRSTSTQATLDGQGVAFNDAESEAETVMNEQKNQGGDAASELRKVVEDRQKRTTQMSSGRSQRFSGSFGGYDGDTISPTSLGGSAYTSEGQGVRCVCNRNEGYDDGGLMIQWYGLLARDVDVWLTFGPLASRARCCFMESASTSPGGRCQRCTYVRSAPTRPICGEAGCETPGEGRWGWHRGHLRWRVSLSGRSDDRRCCKRTCANTRQEKGKQAKEKQAFG